MNFLLHKHNRPEHQIPLPQGLRELMMDMSREVLRAQPQRIPEFIADYLDAMLLVRENTYIAKHTLDDTIQFTIDMADLMRISGMPEEQAKGAANYLRTELKSFTEAGCITQFNERLIVSKLIYEFGLDYCKANKVKKIIQDSFKGYFYRYISYRDAKHGIFGVTWQQAIERTLNVYRMSAPEQAAIDRAAVVIQSAYRGFYQRKIAIKKTKLDKAALVIQRNYRGYDVRKRLPSLRESFEKKQKALKTPTGEVWPPPYENLDGVSLDYSFLSLR